MPAVPRSQYPRYLEVEVECEDEDDDDDEEEEEDDDDDSILISPVEIKASFVRFV